MSGSHHHDPIKTHFVKLAIGIGVGAIALIIGIILMAQLALAVYGSRSLKDDPSMAPAAVDKRIAPVAQVAVDPNAPAPAAPIPAVAIPPAAAKGASAATGAGKSTYVAVCAVCHDSGVAGAPKAGDKAAWAVRLKAGKDALYTAAVMGKGAMPPKGGNTALSDGAVKAAVDHLLVTVK